MSIPVDPADLAGALAGFGSGYLLTTSGSSGAVKVVTVDPAVGDDGSLRMAGPGRGTIANLAENTVVTLVFPPAEHHGHTLLVDGVAEVSGAVGEDVLVRATGAVLHRPASHADGPLPPDGCGQDCSRVS